MGNSYTNITLLGPKHEDVLSVLNNLNRRAYISPTISRKTIVYDRSSDDLDVDVLSDLSAELSSLLSCPALAVLVFDDDVLCLRMYEGSSQTVNYNSRGGPYAGAMALCRTFGSKFAFPLLWIIMQMPFVIFEWWRHSTITKLLGIPKWSIATGYRHIHQGELPPGLTENDLEHVPLL